MRFPKRYLFLPSLAPARLALAGRGQTLGAPMRRRALRAWIPAAVAALLLGGCVQASRQPAPSDAAMDAVIPAGNPDEALLATAMFLESNRARAENGVRPMARLPELDSAADEQARHMQMTLYTEHSNPLPGERMPADRVARTGLRAAFVAENAEMLPMVPPDGYPVPAYTYRGLASELVGHWMGSPGHRANLLNPALGFTGCAARFARDGRGRERVYADQVFEQPADGVSTRWPPSAPSNGSRRPDAGA
jgi:uncharacterized protein YkwD